MLQIHKKARQHDAWVCSEHLLANSFAPQTLRLSGRVEIEAESRKIMFVSAGANFDTLVWQAPANRFRPAPERRQTQGGVSFQPGAPSDPSEQTLDAFNPT